MLTIPEMHPYHTIQFARPNQQTGYCFGIYRQLVSNTFSYSHSGGRNGFQSQMILYPELGFGVLLLTNKDGHGLTESPMQKIVDDLVRERLGPNPLFKSGIEKMRKLSPDDPRIQAILGRYWDGDNWIVGFEEGVLGLRMNAQDFYPLTFYDDGGELAGFFGGPREIRFLRSYGDQRRTLVSINRRLMNCDYRSFNDSPLDSPGPGKEEWKAYFGDYEVLWDDEPILTISITGRNGYLYYGDARCIEHEEDLFFTCDGGALDFRSDPPTAANLIMRRKGL
jgi:hypothetical protein